MGERRYRIGELARISGVAAKTIRFYSDSGILPPTATTGAGYRLYSEADRGRLETIRALRDLGFPLPTIATLLGQGDRAVATALRAQLAALEATERTIRRQRVVLHAALHKGEATTLSYLDHAHAHARLGALERQDLLDHYLTRVFDGVAADEGWKAGFGQAATLDLPEELSDAQFAAWLELADLITDADFIARLNAIGRAAWGSADAPRRPPQLDDLYAAADAARRAGHTPDDAVGRGVIDAYLAREAAARGCAPPDPALPGAVLADIAHGDEPRAARYWELLGILKGWLPSPIPDAHRWLVAGLQRRADTPHGTARQAGAEHTSAHDPTPPDDRPRRRSTT
jgi:DNA-binding transcriptional MerR regulator